MRGRRYALRTHPRDFVVEELPKIVPGEKGDFGIYRLKKTNLDTDAALRIIAARTSVPYRAIGCSGLKDRHGESVQYVSVDRKWGDKLDFSDRSLSLELIGYSDRDIRPGSHKGNRFEVTLRRMSRQTLDVLVRNVAVARGLPVPNYFDSQRFGSLRGAKIAQSATGAPHFAIVEVLKGNSEGALKDILTGTYRKEQSRVKSLKRALWENWGNWAKCAELAAEARYDNYEEIFDFLREKGDFERALKLVRDQRIRMGALALQSWLWNEALKRMLLRAIGSAGLVAVPYEAGELLFPKLGGMALKEYRMESKEMAGRAIPLPHPGMSEGNEAFEEHLDRLGLRFEELERLREFGISLSREARPMFAMAPDLEMSNQEEERSNAQRRFSATLRFTLPAGSYATMVIKVLLG